MYLKNKHMRFYKTKYVLNCKEKIEWNEETPMKWKNIFTMFKS